MENYFYRELNRNTVEAVNRGAAFFMNPHDSRIPLISDAYTGVPITGANYYHLKLSNDLSGKNHTEYVKVNEVLSSNIDWLSTLPRESRPRGILYQEDGAIKNAGYSFVMPAAELNQTIYRDNRNASHPGHVPFQTSNAAMSNFHEFVHEQCANAINASLTGCPFRNNISPHEMEQFKTQLVKEISRSPAFMAVTANRARDEVRDFHYLPFDRGQFIEKARNGNSPEFMRLNSAITNHINDMYHNKRNSFNPEFNELARPLVLNIGEPKSAADREITEFLRKQIRQDRTATLIANVFAGTFVEKAIKLVRTGKRIFAGIMIAGAVFNDQNNSANPIMDFCRNASNRMGGGDMPHSRLDDLVKVAGNIMALQELKGDRSLRTSHDQNNARAFYVNLNQLIRDNPSTLDQAIAQVNNNSHHRTQSASRGQIRR